jgi:hypothetical protein
VVEDPVRAERGAAARAAGVAGAGFVEHALGGRSADRVGCAALLRRPDPIVANQ